MDNNLKATSTPKNQPASTGKRPTKIPSLIFFFLVVISLATNGFLAYQNYQLKKEIGQIQTSAKPTPTPSLASSLTNSIDSIKFTTGCQVLINKKSGLSKTIDVLNVFSKGCAQVPSPVISSNGKYAAFSLITTIKKPSLTASQSEIASNSDYVYFLSKDDWVKVDDHGAAETSNLSFLPNNNLKIDLFYDGKPAGSTEFNLSELEKHFDDVVNSDSHEITYSKSFPIEKVRTSTFLF
jgi:hypothetical protein